MKDSTLLLIQKVLLIVIVLILAFDAADSRQKIKALEARPSSNEQEIKSLTAEIEHLKVMGDLTRKTADFAKEQSFECKEWVIEEMKKRNKESEKQNAEREKQTPTPYNYKTFMGGK